MGLVTSLVARRVPDVVKRIAEAVAIAAGGALATWGVEEMKAAVNRRRDRAKEKR